VTLAFRFPAVNEFLASSCASRRICWRRAPEPQNPIGNLHARITIRLNRTWRVMVHPHVASLGARHYKYRKAKDKRNLVEYHFDTSGKLNVSGDGSSQREPCLLRSSSLARAVVFLPPPADHPPSDGLIFSHRAIAIATHARVNIVVRNKSRYSMNALTLSSRS
jgi:hypothetical protein